ncbi:hypothetical protein E4U21_001132 [Claviceps maximensis]|nr:hypothetical protein E4U21_001132 [Claviceps maximensis]
MYPQANPTSPTHKPTSHDCLAAWAVPARHFIRVRNLPWDAVAVGALILDGARSRVLLVQRAGHDSWPYRWEVPGGGVGGDGDAAEVRETILEGLAREVAEETGLRVLHVRRVVAPGGTDGGDAARMAHVFWNSSRTKLVGRFVFEVCVAGMGGETGQVDVPRVVLDEREHCDFVWATEDVVRTGRLELTGPEQRDIILDGFRLARDAASC